MEEGAFVSTDKASLNAIAPNATIILTHYLSPSPPQNFIL